MRATGAGRQAPGPRGYPVVGSGPHLVRDLVGTFARSWRQYGDIVRFQVPGVELFLITHPDYIKHVLDDRQPNYPKDPLSVGKFEPWCGQGLFTSNGEFHFRQRRLAQPAFKGSRIAAFGPTMVDAAAELVDEWRPLADERRILDVTPEMMRLALTIVMQSIFSTALTGDQAGEIARAVRLCNAYTNSRLQRFVELPQVLPSRARREFLAARTLLDGFVYGLIAERRHADAPPDDLLTRFLAARDEKTGERMSDRQLRDEVVTMFLGGYETTALSLVWAFSLLSRHPGAERRMRAEIAEVCGGREPSADDLPALSYTRALVQEVLRLYPSVWTLSRSPLEDDEIGGCRVPAGSQVFISPYLMHRHPGFWPNPEGFDPGRFAACASGGVPLYAYLPFSRGPRRCPGASVALLEVPLVLARILQSYRLTLAPGHVREPTSNVFLYPRGGMPMRVEHISGVADEPDAQGSG
ncbi:cytochrome P450 [Streptomyces sp. T-3]|nr:cytochrome P450 [Streptomyces sp. T-3]